MKRRINSTGRKSITRELISLKLVEPERPSLPRSFVADLSRLAELDVRKDARVYVEPYVTGSSSLMRFDFGTVGAIRHPADTALSDLDADGRILFRIKIVEQSGEGEVGKILAAVNALRPLDEKASDDDRRAILPVASDDLGEAVWELDFPGAARPQLVLNNRIPGLIDRIKTDPLLQGAVIPAVIGQILRNVLDPGNGAVDDDQEWVQDWKQWAANILDRPLDDEALEPDELDRRVKEIMQAFARTARFVSKIEGAEPDGGADE